MSLWASLWSVLRGIGQKDLGVSKTWTLPTGYTNMRDKAKLIATQDRIWDSGAYLPKEADGEEITYCNLAVLAVLNAYGDHTLDDLHADDMMLFLQQSKKDPTMLWIPKPIGDCQLLASEGTIIVAGLTSRQLGQSHGHVCTLTPGEEDFSGHWNKKTPKCLSIGRKAICFRSKGVNWAFVPEPEFYAWVPSL